jgi:DNA-binding NarL/FixJ family response regulator
VASSRSVTLVRDFLERSDKAEDYDPPTPRELDVLKPIAEGKTSKKIAELLVLSVKTVERHRADFLHRHGMRDRVDLTRYAIRCGLIEP